MVRFRTVVPVAACAALVPALQASAAAHVRVSLARGQAPAVAGRPWTAKLVVRPASFAGPVRVTASGRGHFTARATGRRGSYRARLVFPSPGRWTLAATAGGAASKLGSVSVRAPGTPLAFVWPTAVVVEPDGALLVVENGLERVLRIDPTSGRSVTIAAGIQKAYAVARAPSGSVYISGAHVLYRLDGSAAPLPVTEAAADIGPLAVAPNGDVYFATATSLYVLRAAGGPPILVAGGLTNPHGLAIAADGAVLVSDTGTDRLLRVDPATGVAAALAQVGTPDGLDVAGDGTIYVVDSKLRRIVHLDASGASLGFAGPVLSNPYDVQVGPEGALWVVDTAETGHVRRIGPDGTVTTLSKR